MNEYLRELEAAKSFDDDDIFCPTNLLTARELGLKPPRSALLELPRELRDKIWKYALVEPDLFDRRHRSGCPFYSALPGEEVPPAIMLEKSKQNNEQEGEQKDDQEVPWCHCFSCEAKRTERQCALRNCRRLCVSRQGLAVLQTCAKISREGLQIFWKYNNFCFFNGREMLQVLNALTPRAITSIRSLSFRELYDTKRAYYWQKPEVHEVGWLLLRKLTTFSGLRYLEYPARWTRYDTGYHISNLFALSSFKQLVVSMVQHDPVALTDSGPALHMSLSVGWTDMKRASCARGRHAVVRQLLESRRDPLYWHEEWALYKWCHACDFCEQAGAEVVTTAEHMIGVGTERDYIPDYPATQFEQALATLHALGITHSDGALTMETTIFGMKRHVTVWGLPGTNPTRSR